MSLYPENVGNYSFYHNSISPDENYYNVGVYDEDGVFHNFKAAYVPIHGYLALVICVFGVITNVLNIIVLTRKTMLSPTNAILTGLAVADMVVMLDYIPFSIHQYITLSVDVAEQYSYQWTVFILFHAHFSVVFHTISTWLTILLAIWRVLTVSYPTESKTWFTMRNAVISILSIYVLVPICLVPVYLSFTITEVPYNESYFYRVDFSEVSLRHNKLLKNINFWVVSVGTKLVPCVLLTYFSLAMIRILIEADKRKARLRSTNEFTNVTSSKNNNQLMGNLTVPNRLGTDHHNNQNQTTNEDKKDADSASDECDCRQWDFMPLSNDSETSPKSNLIKCDQNLEPPKESQTPSHADASPLTTGQLKSANKGGSSAVLPHPATSGLTKRNCYSPNHPVITLTSTTSSQVHDRTTKMLLAVLLLFLITELPAGILTFLSIFYGESFFAAVYNPMGEMMDMLALINSAVNFILYCTMSRLFRKTFKKIFCSFGGPSDESPPNQTSRGSHHQICQQQQFVSETEHSPLKRSLVTKMGPEQNGRSSNKNSISSRYHRNSEITFV